MGISPFLSLIFLLLKSSSLYVTIFVFLSQPLTRFFCNFSLFLVGQKFDLLDKSAELYW